MIHPHTELRYINAEIGFGVFATQRIPAGTIIWAKDRLDREFTPDEFIGLNPAYFPVIEHHTFRNRYGNYILCWDIGRYLNHSFKANCIATAYELEVAVRDIEAGEELTDDYGFLNILEAFTPSDEGTARKVVYPDDLLRYAEQWDEQVKCVVPQLLLAAQPLRALVSDENWTCLEEFAAGKQAFRSIRENYFDASVGQNK